MGRLSCTLQPFLQNLTLLTPPKPSGEKPLCSSCCTFRVNMPEMQFSRTNLPLNRIQGPLSRLIPETPRTTMCLHSKFCLVRMKSRYWLVTSMGCGFACYHREPEVDGCSGCICLPAFGNVKFAQLNLACFPPRGPQTILGMLPAMTRRNHEPLNLCDCSNDCESDLWRRRWRR